MADVEIDNLAQIGLILDQKPYRLPMNAWEVARNVRYKEDAVTRMAGDQAVFGTPGVAPYFLFPVTGAGQVWWLYMGLAKAYVYNGASHTDITRTSGGDYSGVGAEDFNGTVLGGIPVLNNGVDDPQFWASYATGTKLADLSNWPASTSCKVIRAFGPYLVAYNVTKSGTQYAHMVKWSHAAEVGTLPSSWDETDASLDAGETELEDAEAGPIVDAVRLGQNMFIYKQGSVWVQRFIGGRFIFRFDTFLPTTGIIGPRCACVCLEGRYHFFATQDDVLLHDGNSTRSVMGERVRRAFMASYDNAAVGTSFCFDNPLQKEVWLCYPEVGQSVPNMAWVWSYSDGVPGKWSQREIGFQSVGLGDVDVAADTRTWADLSGTSWESLTGLWSNSSSGRRLVAADPANTRFRLLDQGTDFSGTAFTASLQRTGLAFFGQKPDKTPLVDFKKRKYIRRLWLRADGAPFRLRVGVQDTVEAPVVWQSYVTFDPATMVYVDVNVSGRALSIDIEDIDAGEFLLTGYKAEVFPAGDF